MPSIHSLYSYVYLFLYGCMYICTWSGERQASLIHTAREPVQCDHLHDIHAARNTHILIRHSSIQLYKLKKWNILIILKRSYIYEYAPHSEMYSQKQAHVHTRTNTHTHPKIHIYIHKYTYNVYVRTSPLRRMVPLALVNVFLLAEISSTILLAPAPEIYIHIVMGAVLILLVV